MDALIGLYMLIQQAQKNLDELKLQEVQNATTELIQSIMQCESGGNPDSVNTNDKKITGYASYGLFQFQPYTFLSFAKKYKVLPQDANPPMKELVRLMKIPIYNQAVAHGMIKDGLTEQHWTNCYRKYKLAVKSSSWSFP